MKRTLSQDSSIDSNAKKQHIGDSDPQDIELVTFGKHKNKTFQQVLKSDPGYCEWCLEQSEPSGGLARFQQYLKPRMATPQPKPQRTEFFGWIPPCPSECFEHYDDVNYDIDVNNVNEDMLWDLTEEERDRAEAIMLDQEAQYEREGQEKFKKAKESKTIECNTCKKYISGAYARCSMPAPDIDEDGPVCMRFNEYDVKHLMIQECKECAEAHKCSSCKFYFCVVCRQYGKPDVVRCGTCQKQFCAKNCAVECYKCRRVECDDCHKKGTWALCEECQIEKEDHRGGGFLNDDNEDAVPKGTYVCPTCIDETGALENFECYNSRHEDVFCTF